MRRAIIAPNAKKLWTLVLGLTLFFYWDAAARGHYGLASHCGAPRVVRYVESALVILL